MPYTGATSVFKSGCLTFLRAADGRQIIQTNIGGGVSLVNDETTGHRGLAIHTGALTSTYMDGGVTDSVTVGGNGYTVNSDGTSSMPVGSTEIMNFGRPTPSKPAMP